MLNKEQVLNQVDKVKTNLRELITLIEQIDDFQESLILNIISEIGLNNLEELEFQFRRLKELTEKAEVIEGYQVWVNYDNLNIIANNKHVVLNNPMEKLFKEIQQYTETKDQAKSIFKWYFEKVY